MMAKKAAAKKTTPTKAKRQAKAAVLEERPGPACEADAAALDEPVGPAFRPGAEEALLDEVMEEGREAGRSWASRRAELRTLKRLDRCRSHFGDDWDRAYLVGAYWNSAYSAAERFAFSLLDPMIEGDRSSVAEFWQDALDYGNLLDDHDAITGEEGFVQGFAEGALEVFDGR